MHYQERLPSPKLHPFIKCFWQLEGNATDTKEELIVPDGKMELIFQLGDIFEQSRSTPDVKGCATIVGQLTKSIMIKPTGSIGLFGVRFTPQGFTAIFEERSDFLLDKEVFISDLDSKGSEIEKKILLSKSFPTRVKIIEDFLITHLDKSRVSDLNTRIGSRILLESPSEDQIFKTAKEMKISLRQFERQFKTQVGVSPSYFIKIARLQKAIKTKLAHPEMTLALVAAESGYYDQSHFSRDCKEITGLGPKTYFMQEHNMTNFFSA